MNRKWYRIILRRRLIVALLLIAQIVLFVFMVTAWNKYYSILATVLTVVSLVVSLCILTRREKGAYKLTWIFVILAVPVFGVLLYLYVRLQSSNKFLNRRQAELSEHTRPLYGLDGMTDSAYNDAVAADPRDLTQLSYLKNFAGFPVYPATEAVYLSPGEEKFDCLIRELKKAKRYIFLEYFIIHEGLMWDTILDILREKVREGVEVRVMYDDIGCFLTLPKNYHKTLRGYGIKCTVFNPFRPVLSTIQNNRDHRKIVSIDGVVAFTGGVNLSDEYINAVQRFGHWKDAAVVLRGPAAWSMTLMFLEMWSLSGKNMADAPENFSAYMPEYFPEPAQHEGGWGFVQPYCDSPMDSENVGEHVYLQILNHASDYVYISTPYLIVDDSMISALTLAAKSGVDVRIITPHTPDKRLVHTTTRSYYRDLIAAGVKIYEYSKGFIHSKTFVSDDRIATVGTTNLDFRSLYTHFECGACLYGSPAVAEIKQDYLNTLEQCQQITPEQCRDNIFIRLFHSFLRLCAPLM